jgi:hypothetical protein
MFIIVEDSSVVSEKAAAPYLIEWMAGATIQVKAFWGLEWIG